MVNKSLIEKKAFLQITEFCKEVIKLTLSTVISYYTRQEVFLKCRYGCTPKEYRKKLEN